MTRQRVILFGIALLAMFGLVAGLGINQLMHEKEARPKFSCEQILTRYTADKKVLATLQREKWTVTELKPEDRLRLDNEIAHMGKSVRRYQSLGRKQKCAGMPGKINLPLL